MKPNVPTVLFLCRHKRQFFLFSYLHMMKMVFKCFDDDDDDCCQLIYIQYLTKSRIPIER